MPSHNAAYLAKLKAQNQDHTAQLNEEFRRQLQAHIWEGRNVGGRSEVVPISCPTCGTQKLYKVGPRNAQGVPSYVQPTGQTFIPPY